MRVVSLACSNTEIVCALGRSADLVGVDDHSDYPGEVVSKLPRVGPDLQIDPQKVAALEPDLVLASLTVPGHEKVVESIEAAGLPCQVFAPTSLEEVLESIEALGEAIAAADSAIDLTARLRLSLAATSAAPAEKPKVLVQWWPGPVIAPGRRSWVHDLLERAGGANPLAAEDVISRPLTDDEIAEIDPDVIVLSWCGIATDKLRPEVVTENPLWGEVSAVQNQNVVVIPEALLGRPGPRLADGYKELRAVIERVAAGRKT